MVSPRTERLPKRTLDARSMPVSERSRWSASLMKRALRSSPSRIRPPATPRQVEATTAVAAASTTRPTIMAIISSTSVKPARPAGRRWRMAITGR